MEGTHVIRVLFASLFNNTNRYNPLTLLTLESIVPLETAMRVFIYSVAHINSLA